jgi:hypothetical protein
MLRQHKNKAKANDHFTQSISREESAYDDGKPVVLPKSVEATTEDEGQIRYGEEWHIKLL